MRIKRIGGLSGLLLAAALFLAVNLNAQYTTAGSAVALGNNCYRLTQNGVTERGAVWSNNTINLNNGFDITAWITQVAQGPSAGNAADGMAFVLQSTGTGAMSALAGNTCGYANSYTGTCTGPYSGGINPSLAIELDLFNNTTCINDVAGHHMAIHRDGDFTTVLAPHQVLNGGTITSTPGNYICRPMRIQYNGTTHNLNVWFGGVQIYTNFNYDIAANIFSGNPNVYFGFTGATGGITAEQNVCFEFAAAGNDTLICESDVIQLNGSGGGTYAWEPAILLTNANTATPTFDPSSAFTYPFEVSVTNSFGCVDKDTMIVTVAANPVAEAGNAQSLCAGDSVQIGSAGTAGITYSWTPTNGLSNPNVAQPNASPATTTMYYLTATDPGTTANCASIDSVLVTVNPVPVADAGNNGTVCSGTCMTIGTAAQAGLNYSWTPAAGLSATNVAQPDACPTVDTRYYLTVTDPASGCFSTDSIDVSVIQSPIAIAPPDTAVCPGAGVVLLGDTTGGDIVQWSPAAGLSSTTDINPTASPVTPTMYYLTVFDTQTGCQGIDSVFVDINSADSIDIQTADVTICNVDTVAISTFSTAGIDTWSWSPGTGISNSSIPEPNLFPNTTTQYFLTGTNSTTGCFWMDSITVSVFELQTNSPTEFIICRGDTVCFDVTGTNGSGDYSYNWTGDPVDSDTIATPCAAPQNSANYTAVIFDNMSGCSDTVNISVAVGFVNAQVDPQYAQINPGQMVELFAMGGITYSWTPTTNITCDSCPNPTVYPGEEGTVVYTVTVMDSLGCSDQASVTIDVDSLIVPNVFTPNGDGINDVLYLNYWGSANFQAAVYDRWGKLIFTTTNPTQHWDGTLPDGSDAPEGVYYLQLRIHADDAIPGKDKNKAFAITLLR